MGFYLLRRTKALISKRSARNWDIALNLLIIPGIGAATGDQEERVAEAKGRELAIQNEYGSRCDGSSASILSTQDDSI